MSTAKQIVHWPGQDTPACDEHLNKLVGLGAVLGIQIAWTPCAEQPCANCETIANKERRAEPGIAPKGDRK
jgi:hypothetical protein